MPTSVVIVDDHRTFADLMRMGIDAEDDLCCVGVAHSLQDARRLATTVPCDAAIIDLALPDGNGAEVVAEIHRASPGARIVILTAHPRSDVARRALAAGAHAVLPKHGSLDDVFAAVRATAPASPPRDEPALLTPREHEVLTLLSQGRDVQAIASHLGLSPHTVRDHVKAILAKFDARTQLEAVMAAARAGVLLLDPQ